MHSIYHTEGIVIRQHQSREANKVFTIFTRDLGLVSVNAQGIRKSGAKLGAHLIDYALVRCDILRGKGNWRIIGAQTTINPCMANVEKPHKRSYVRLLALIDRFVGNDIVMGELFDHAIDCANSISIESDTKLFDTWVIWKAFVMLGYVAVAPELENRLILPIKNALTDFPIEIIDKLIKDVNTSIQQSHL